MDPELDLLHELLDPITEDRYALMARTPACLGGQTRLTARDRRRLDRVSRPERGWRPLRAERMER